jgi:hypothetical protein
MAEFIVVVRLEHASVGAHLKIVRSELSKIVRKGVM